MVVIRGGTVVTMREEGEVLRADVKISDGKIVEVGENLEDDEVVDATDCVVMPAFANLHTHVAMTLMRGLGAGCQLKEWLEKHIWPVEMKMKEEDVYVGSLAGVVESVRSGVTLINDMYFFSSMVGKAVEEVGINAVIAEGLSDANGKTPDTVLSMMEAYPGNEHVRWAMACHSPYTCSPELILGAKQYANKHDMLFHIHAAETGWENEEMIKKYGKRSIELLDELGVLDDHSVLAHVVHVNKAEISLLGRKHVVVVHNPVSNLKLASGGICPVVELDNAGVTMTLGTDGPASNDSHNMFETAKVGALLQNHVNGKAGAVPAYRVLCYLTKFAWSSMGFNAGTIEPGKQAEIVVLSRTPSLYPGFDVYSNVLYAASPQNVRHVISRGRVVLKDYEFVNVDEKEIYRKMNKAAHELVSG